MPVFSPAGAPGSAPFWTFFAISKMNFFGKRSKNELFKLFYEFGLDIFCKKFRFWTFLMDTGPKNFFLRKSSKSKKFFLNYLCLQGELPTFGPNLDRDKKNVEKVDPCQHVAQKFQKHVGGPKKFSPHKKGHCKQCWLSQLLARKSWKHVGTKIFFTWLGMLAV